MSWLPRPATSLNPNRGARGNHMSSSIFGDYNTDERNKENSPALESERPNHRGACPTDYDTMKRENGQLLQRINNLESSINMLKKNDDNYKKELAETNSKMIKLESQLVQKDQLIAASNKNISVMKEQLGVLSQEKLSLAKEKENISNNLMKMQAERDRLEIKLYSGVDPSDKRRGQKIHTTPEKNNLDVPQANLNHGNRSAKTETCQTSNPGISVKDDRISSTNDEEIKRKVSALETQCYRLENEKIALQRKWDREKEDLNARNMDSLVDIQQLQRENEELKKTKKHDMEKLIQEHSKERNALLKQLEDVQCEKAKEMNESKCLEEKFLSLQLLHDTLKKDAEKLQSDFDNLEKSLSVSENDASKLDLSNPKDNESILSLRQLLKEREDELASVAIEKAALLDKISDAVQANSQKEETIVSCRDEIEKLKAALLSSEVPREELLGQVEKLTKHDDSIPASNQSTEVSFLATTRTESHPHPQNAVDVSEQLKELHSQIESLEHQLLSARDEIQSQAHVRHSLEAELHKTKTDLAILEDEFDDASANHEKLNLECKDLMDKLQDSEARCEQLSLDHKSARQCLDEKMLLEKEMEEIIDSLSKENGIMSKNLEATKLELIGLKENSKQFSLTNEALFNEKAQLESQLSDLRCDITEKDEEISALRSKLCSLKKTISEMKEHLDERIIEEERCGKELTILRERLVEKEAALTDMNLLHEKLSAGHLKVNELLEKKTLENISLQDKLSKSESELQAVLEEFQKVNMDLENQTVELNDSREMMMRSEQQLKSMEGLLKEKLSNKLAKDERTRLKIEEVRNECNLLRDAIKNVTEWIKSCYHRELKDYQAHFKVVLQRLEKQQTELAYKSKDMHAKQQLLTQMSIQVDELEQIVDEKNSKIEILGSEQEFLTSRVEELTKAIDSITEEKNVIVSNVMAEKSAVMCELESLKLSIKETELKYESLQIEYQKLSECVSRSNGEQTLHEKIGSLECLLKEKESEVARLNAESQQVVQLNQNLENELAQSKSEYSTLNAASKKAESDYQDIMNKLEKELERTQTLEEEKVQHLQSLEDISKDLEAANDDLFSKIELLDQLNSQIQQLFSQLQHSEENAKMDRCKLSLLQKEVEEKKEQISQLLRDIEGNQNLLQQAEQATKTNLMLIEQLQIQVKEKDHRIKELDDNLASSQHGMYELQSDVCNHVQRLRDLVHRFSDLSKYCSNDDAFEDAKKAKKDVEWMEILSKETEIHFNSLQEQLLLAKEELQQEKSVREKLAEVLEGKVQNENETQNSNLLKISELEVQLTEKINKISELNSTISSLQDEMEMKKSALQSQECQTEHTGLLEEQRLKAECENLQTKFNEADHELQSLLKKVEEQKFQMETLQQQLVQAAELAEFYEKELALEHSRTEDLGAQLVQAESEKSVYIEEASLLKTTSKSYIDQIDQLNNQLLEMQELLEKTKTQADANQKQKEEELQRIAKQSLEELEKVIKAQGDQLCASEVKVKQLESAVDELSTSRSQEFDTLEKKLEFAKEENANLQSSNIRLEKCIAGYEAQVKELKTSLDMTKSNLEDKESSLKLSEERMSEITTSVSELKKAESRLVTQLAECQQTVAKLEEKINRLESENTASSLKLVQAQEQSSQAILDGKKSSELMIQKDKEIAGLKEEMIALKEKLQFRIEDYERLESQSAASIKEVDSLLQENLENSREIKRLKALLKKFEQSSKKVSKTSNPVVDHQKIVENAHLSPEQSLKRPYSEEVTPFVKRKLTDNTDIQSSIDHPGEVLETAIATSSRQSPKKVVTVDNATEESTSDTSHSTSRNQFRKNSVRKIRQESRNGGDCKQQ